MNSSIDNMMQQEQTARNKRYADSLNQALHEAMSHDPDVLLIGEDLLDPYGGAFKVAKGLSTQFPDRLISTPISESAITGAATGMAIRGLKPVVEIMFGDFLTLCVDQIVNHASKFHWVYNEQVNVPIVIRAPMGGYRGYGATHSQTLEALFMSVPFLDIVAPSLLHEPGELLKHAILKAEHPVLFIENKTLYAKKLIGSESDINGARFTRSVINPDSAFPVIKLEVIENEKADVTIVTYGGMVEQVCEAAWNVFMEEEIICNILAPSRIKPVGFMEIESEIKTSGKILTVEEGIRSGGWGAEVIAGLHERATGNYRFNADRVGASELPIPSSRHQELEVLPSTIAIQEKITALYERG